MSKNLKTKKEIENIINEKFNDKYEVIEYSLSNEPLLFKHVKCGAIINEPVARAVYRRHNHPCTICHPNIGVGKKINKIINMDEIDPKFIKLGNDRETQLIHDQFVKSVDRVGNTKFFDIVQQYSRDMKTIKCQNKKCGCIKAIPTSSLLKLTIDGDCECTIDTDKIKKVFELHGISPVNDSLREIGKFPSNKRLFKHNKCGCTFNHSLFKILRFKPETIIGESCKICERKELLDEMCGTDFTWSGDINSNKKSITFTHICGESFNHTIKHILEYKFNKIDNFIHCKCQGVRVSSVLSALIKKLVENKIDFEVEHKLVKNTDTGKFLRFDVWLPKFNLAIEFDGAQHYVLTGKWFSLGTIRRDIIKNNECIKKNINILRIDYTFRNKNIDELFKLLLDRLNTEIKPYELLTIEEKQTPLDYRRIFREKKITYNSENIIAKLKAYDSSLYDDLRQENKEKKLSEQGKNIKDRILENNPHIQILDCDRHWKGRVTFKYATCDHIHNRSIHAGIYQNILTHCETCRIQEDITRHTTNNLHYEKKDYKRGDKITFTCSCNHQTKMNVSDLLDAKSKVYCSSNSCKYNRRSMIGKDSTLNAFDLFDDKLKDKFGDEFKILHYISSNDPAIIQHTCGSKILNPNPKSILASNKHPCTYCYPSMRAVKEMVINLSELPVKLHPIEEFNKNIPFDSEWNDRFIKRFNNQGNNKIYEVLEHYHPDKKHIKVRIRKCGCETFQNGRSLQTFHLKGKCKQTITCKNYKKLKQVA